MAQLHLRGDNPDPADRLTPAELDGNLTSLNLAKVENGEFSSLFLDSPVTTFTNQPAGLITPSDTWVVAAAKVQAQIVVANEEAVGVVTGGVGIGSLVAAHTSLPNLVERNGATYLKTGVTAARATYPDAPWVKKPPGNYAYPLPGGAGQLWYCFTQSPSIFVAAPYVEGTMYATSTDGTNWTQRNFPGSGRWVASAYGNGTFVVVGNSSTVAMTSPDGLNWTQRVFPMSAAQWMAFGAGLFVVVDSGSASYYTSPDGINWTPRALPQADAWRRIAFANGQFVLVSEGGGYVLSSTDGINWTVGTIQRNASNYALAFGNGIWVTAGYDSNLGATSPDGVNWTTRTLPSKNNWRGLGFADGLFFVFSPQSSNYLTSPDGITWTTRTLTEGVGGLNVQVKDDTLYTPSMGYLGVMTVIGRGEEVVDNLVALYPDPVQQTRQYYMRVK